MTSAVAVRRGARRVGWLATGAAAVVVLTGACGAVGHSAEESQTLRHAVTTLSVRLGSGNLGVHGGAAPGTVEVSRHLRWGGLSSRPQPQESWAGDGLSITEPGCGRLGGCSIDYVLEVPDGTQLDLGTGSGNIVVSGDFGATGLEAGSGNIEGSTLRLEDLRVRTGSGNIGLELEEVPGRVEARAGSGNVGLHFGAAPTSVRVSTGSGNIRLGVPDDQPYAVHVDVGSGEHDVQVPTDPHSSRVLDLTAGSGSVVVSHG